MLTHERSEYRDEVYSMKQRTNVIDPEMEIFICHLPRHVPQDHVQNDPRENERTS